MSNILKDNILGEKVYKQRTKKGLSQEELGKRIGVSHVMISNYEKGIKSPKLEVLKKIADVLEVDFNYLFLNNPKESTTFKIKVFSDPVCAGDGTLVDDNKFEELITLNSNDYNKYDNLFAVKIKGDSMINAYILNGDIAICRPQIEFNNNDIVIAIHEGESIIKRFKQTKPNYILVPENTNYDTIIVNGDTKIIAKVIEIKRLLN